MAIKKMRSTRYLVSFTKKSKTMNKRKRNKNKTNKNKKSRKYRKKGGDGDGHGDDKTTCCVCGIVTNISDTLIPLDCLQKRREKAKGPHRLCQHCWWNPVTGFAKEGVNHKCPCCKEGVPFPTLKVKESSEVIDLTEDD